MIDGFIELLGGGLALGQTLAQEPANSLFDLAGYLRPCLMLASGPCRGPGAGFGWQWK